MCRLSKLNPPQREAASHGGGPLLVLAGAGSGKTRVITHRIARLIERGVPPRAICAVTFTNKAAAEMRERVAHAGAATSSSRASCTISTFHAFGLQILRHGAQGARPAARLRDLRPGRSARRRARGDPRSIQRRRRRFDAKAILTRISLAKNAFVAPDEYEGNPGRRLRRDHRAGLSEVPGDAALVRAFDFDDLIFEPVRLFERDPTSARAGRSASATCWSTSTRTRTARSSMLQLLVAQHSNLCVVGDDDQSIYGWRGADPQHPRVRREFPGAKVVKLEQNYRSTKPILAGRERGDRATTRSPRQDAVVAARRGEMIRRGRARPPRPRRGGSRARSAQLAEGRPAAEATSRSSIARTSRRSSLEEELRTAGVPYGMFGGQQFFERKEVKDVLAYLRVALNPRDEIALRRIINYPPRGIGATTVEKLVLAAQAEHAPLWEALSRDRRPGAAARARRARATASRARPVIERTLGEASRAATTSSTDEDADRGHRALRRSAPRRGEHVGRAAPDRQRRGPAQLARALRRKGKGVERARRVPAHAVARHQGRQKHEDNGDKVMLTTLHGAKGLEFPVCFMIGLEEELLPHIRTLQPQATDVHDADHATDISEERRLCYVGITRAQRKLYLTRACTRVSRGRVGAAYAVAVPARDPRRAARGARPRRGGAPEGAQGRGRELLREFGVRGLTRAACSRAASCRTLSRGRAVAAHVSGSRRPDRRDCGMPPA